MRFYAGTDDQKVDPLIMADAGADFCPAFRGIAYLVFENLALADFGNRIPALTFEILGSNGTISLRDLLDEGLIEAADNQFEGLQGFSHESGSYADLLETIGVAWPQAFDGSGGKLTIRSASVDAKRTVRNLPAPVVGEREEFGSITGCRSERSNEVAIRQLCLRYYDIDRDYQPGLQRSRAQAGNGDIATVELPASLSPDAARQLADVAAMRRRGSRETISYRVAELDEDLYPGAFVKIPDRAAIWMVDGWEWRHTGVELTLNEIPPALATGQVAQGSSGQTQPPPEIQNGPTTLAAFGLPWDGVTNSGTPALFAAAASPAAGWRGAALFADFGDGALVPAGTTGRTPAVMGVIENALDAASPHIVDRETEIIVDLTGMDMALFNADFDALALGANRALVGAEIIQFNNAEAVGQGRWRLSNLLRGRAGTEFAIEGHVAGESFVLLDDRLVALDPILVGPPEVQSIAAIGSEDPEPVIAPVIDPNAALRPYSPVHGQIRKQDADTIILQWTRRNRGSFAWLDAVDVPLNEATENYDIRYVSDGATIMSWRTPSPRLELSNQWSEISQLDGHFEVRQVGDRLLSPPLIINPADAG